MGYTHYWICDMTEDVWGDARRDVSKLLRLTNGARAGHVVPLGNAFGEGDSPAYEDESISFNGKRADSHETVMFARSLDTSCKTARKPYDVIVVACMAVMKDVCGVRFIVHSDGPSDHMRAGTMLAASLLGRTIANPLKASEVFCNGALATDWPDAPVDYPVGSGNHYSDGYGASTDCLRRAESILAAYRPR